MQYLGKIIGVAVALMMGGGFWGVVLGLCYLGLRYALPCFLPLVLGAVMAVFSTNLKYILACSSLSQIGFILVGVAMLTLLGEHNALAAHGTVLYMLNHSLVKLTLFLFAGVVYYNTHQLDLNRIRGFGRGKPLLHGLFLCGACSLAGIPGFLGYISKTLVHEAVVELAVETGSSAITAVEWLFLLSGGLTVAYLTKIYVAVFWQKAPPDAHAASRRNAGIAKLYSGCHACRVPRCQCIHRDDHRWLYLLYDAKHRFAAFNAGFPQNAGRYGANIACLLQILWPKRKQMPRHHHMIQRPRA